MNVLRVIVSVVLIAAVITGVYLFVDAMMAREARESLRRVADRWEDQYTGAGAQIKITVNWGGNATYDQWGSTQVGDMPKIEGSVMKRALSDSLSEYEKPYVRFWCALIAAETGFLRRSVDALKELASGDASDPVTARAWKFLYAFLQHGVDYFKGAPPLPVEKAYPGLKGPAFDDHKKIIFKAVDEKVKRYY